MFEKIIFLGTGAGMPTNERNVTSIAVILNKNRDFWLFDCGEGTQQQIHRAGLKLSKLKKIFITHLHGDHLFGLPGLLATRGLQGIKESINIFGPTGLENYLKNCFDYSRTHIPYSYSICAIEKDNFITKKMLWKKENCAVYCAILNHKVESFGYTIINKEIKRNIITEKLLELGIQPGPIYQTIKEKSQITLEDGRILRTEGFIKESTNIKKICYCGDTTFTENAVTLSRNADLLIHEATFSGQEKVEAERSFHSTTDDAIMVAKNANVKRLIVTHISPRYHSSSQDSEKWNIFREEARSQYPGIIFAEDFLEIKILIN